MIRYYQQLMLAILVTLLSLNSFAYTAVQAAKDTKKGKVNTEIQRIDNLFINIRQAAYEGECSIFQEYEFLPEKYWSTLINLGYKVENWDFSHKVKITWCD